MKSILSIVFIGITSVAIANVGKYERTMLQNIAALNEATTSDEYQKVINTLDRIGMAESNKWEPYYYGAYGNILLSIKVSKLTEKDQYLDEAQIRLDKAVEVSPENVELITLQGFVHMMRLAADPATRGQQYAPLAMQEFNKAVAMDDMNPRALIMRAQMKFGTAQFFGSGTEEACSEAAKSLELFDNAVKSEDSLAPGWGRGQAEGFVKQCSTGK